MADIRHRVGIAAPPARVYEALTTTEGLSGWWTRIVEGDPTPGGTLRFFFGQPAPSAVMEVTESVPGGRVEWRWCGWGGGLGGDETQLRPHAVRG
jgi:uncharacterized protein YndB with AHSA1/START domain